MRNCACILALTLMTTACPALALQKGDPAPNFSLTSTEGVVVSLSDLSGKVVAISFWATWGTACSEQLKQLQQLHRELGDKGLVVLGINEREDRDQAASFAQRNGLTFRVLLDEGGVARLYGVNGVPDFWLVDRKGVLRDRFIGYGPSLPKAIREAVAAAVGKTTTPMSGGATADPGAPIPVSLRAYAHLQLGSAHLNIGDAFVKAGYRDAGHFNEALRELRSGVAMDPKNVDLRIWLGLILERKNEKSAAINEYQTALLLDPANIYAQDALRRLGVPPGSSQEEEGQEEEEELIQG